MADVINSLQLPSGSLQQTALIKQIISIVLDKMHQHDPSHNPAHVFRVVRLAHKLLSLERSNPQVTTTAATPAHYYDDLTVTLAALLHDNSDHKYAAPDTNPDEAIYQILASHSIDHELARKIQTIVSHVSFSREKKGPPGKCRELIDNGYPELAIVQDADRLDAIGAVGIGRCFTYLGAKGAPRGGGGGGGGGWGWELEGAIEHFVEKLEKLEGMMKTGSGRELARVRTERLREFRRWWEEETLGE